MKKDEFSLPAYYRIAVDIAAKIVSGEYNVGQKIYARSSIASQYGISSETARRAISVLADLEIVETEKGSGVKIRSAEKARLFIQQSKNVNTTNSLKNQLLNDFEKQIKDMETLQRDFKHFVDSMERVRKINPFAPFSLKITSSMSCINKTVAETNFWHNTTATIVAIKRGETFIISPGPYASFEEDDVLYFIGDEDTYQKVLSFMNSSIS